MDRKEVISYVDLISNIVISLTLFLLPLIFTTSTTDFFVIPKQLLIIAAALILLVLWGVRILVEKKIVVTVSPLNFPLIAFALVLFVSSILSANAYDSLLQAIPVVAVIILSLLIINVTKTKRTFSIILSSFVIGAAFSALITVAYSFKFYFLPISGTQNQFFNTVGPSFQQLIYLLPVFVFSLAYLARKFNFPNIRLPRDIANDYGFYVQVISMIIIALSIVAIIYQMAFSPNKPILLPYIYGFQTAFASISQDAGRFITALLFGSGYGTFLIDFTRFKIPAFNLEQNIWSLSFSFSSSYFLELIATTGILGTLSYLWIIISYLRTRTIASPLFIGVFAGLVLSLILPFSYVSLAGLILMIGIYIAYLNLEEDRRVYDVSLSLVSTKRGIPTFEASPIGEHGSRKDSMILPVVVALLVIIIVAFVGFYSVKMASSDVKFASSLKAAQENNGQKTYELQTAAINEFPYRSDYHRIFSQVNLALANSIASGVAPGSSPSAQVQQNIITLLQQSINSGRNAVTLSPRTSLNWQNLGIVYRSLINVGQNADQFALASMNQAIALDPYNPNLYIVAGGIYYQLGLWDQAANQFQVAINLKRDFANAYYNLGHAYESKGDLQNALTAYQVVRQLSVDNKENLDRINAEIKALEDKIGSQAQAPGESVSPETEQTPLSISEPETNIPEQKPPIKISPPPTTTPTPSTSVTPSPSVSPTVAQ